MQLKQLKSNIPFIQKSIGFSMTYRATCCNHKQIQFDIPQNVDEATTLDAWRQIKSIENHLKKNPKCKMIRSLID
jgi:hypothetical protein